MSRFRGARARRRSSSCARIRAIRESGSTTRSSTNWPLPSRSAGSSNPWSFARFPASRMLTKSLPASAAGEPRSGRDAQRPLTNLPEHTRSLLAGGQISAGHARALLAVANPDAVANRIVTEGLTVRDIERLSENSGKTPRPRGTAPVDADTAALQDKLRLELGTKVKIRHSGESGEIHIAFGNLDQLHDFCRRLCQPTGLSER